MDVINSESTLSAETLWKQALQWTPQQWKANIPNLTSHQMMIVAPAIAYEHDAELRKEILCSLSSGLKDPSKFEAIGKVMDISQILELLTLSFNDPAGFTDKLTPLFVGMPHSVFRGMLHHLEKEQLIVLKKEAITEPVQHHLTLLTH